jgi:predicted phosphodiesterase
MEPEPKRILAVGDTHGSSWVVVQAIEFAAANGCDAILQVGDWGHWVPGSGTKGFYTRVQRELVKYGITLYWVAGNHECWPDIIERLGGSREPKPLYKRYPNIIHLPTGFRWGWWGRTWMALGGAASVDRLGRVPGKSWWPEELLSTEDIEYASRPGKVDVIISHDVPTGVDIPGFGPGLAPNMDSGFPLITLLESIEHRRKVRQVVDAVKPSMIIAGHYHIPYTRYLDATYGKVLVLGLNADAGKGFVQLLDKPCAAE